MKILRKITQIAAPLLFVVCLTACTNEHFTRSPDGLKIGYSIYGQGDDLIVFVHGWSCDRSYWQGQVDFFSEDYQVVTMDLGGHGQSGVERENWTISSLGDDVMAVVAQLEYEHLYLVGHSMGGMVVLDAASKAPSAHTEAIVVDFLRYKYWPIPQPDFEDFIKPFRQDFVARTKSFVAGMFRDDADPLLVDTIAADMAAADPEIAMALLMDLWVNDFDPLVDRLNEMSVPMTLINADNEPPTNEEQLTALGFDITYVRGTGHFIMNEAPDAFNRHLQQLLQKAQ